MVLHTVVLTIELITIIMDNNVHTITMYQIPVGICNSSIEN
jgi:hypothetical protein